MNPRFQKESHRLQDVQSPIIPVVGHWARENPGTLSLGQGIVHYPPPKEVLKVFESSFQDPATHRYQLVDGIQSLLDIIHEKLQKENGFQTDHPFALTVTAGANMGFLNAILAITDPGDEVILLSPYYFNHEMALTMVNVRPVPVDTDPDYQPVPERIRSAVTSRTRAVVTVSPNNPSGAVYPRETLMEINRMCRESGLYHIHDQAYEYFVYEGESSYSPGSDPDACDYTISLFSLSKAYGFAGWRIGYMAYPPQLREAVRKVQDTNLICAPVLSQLAAVEAMKCGRSYCRPFVERMEAVRAGVMNELVRVDRGCRFVRTKGAFYFLVELDTPLSSMEVAKRLIHQYKVAAIPGTAFGIRDRCVLRIAYGSLESKSVMDGMARLISGLEGILEGRGKDKG